MFVRGNSTFTLEIALVCVAIYGNTFGVRRSTSNYGAVPSQHPSRVDDTNTKAFSLLFQYQRPIGTFTFIRHSGTAVNRKEGNRMKIYRNANYVQRNYECTNIVACVTTSAPSTGANWVEADESVLQGLTKLWREGDVTFWGYL